MNLSNRRFANNIDAILKKRGLTPTELEKLITIKVGRSVTHSYMSRMIRDANKDKTSNVSLDVADAICDSLDIPLHRLLSPQGMLEGDEVVDLIDVDLFAKAQNEAESMAIDMSIESRDFMRIAAAILYNGYVKKEEKEASRSVMKLSRNY